MEFEIWNLKLVFHGVLWILWCSLHSLMISWSVISMLKKKFGDSFRYYRIFFNVVSILTLVPVLAYSQTLRSEPLFDWSGFWRPVQLILALCALTLFYTGSRHYDLRQFLGIRQISEHESAKGLTRTGNLDNSGILGVIRHPWYTAAILIIWVRPLDVAVLVTNSILTAYLVIGTFLEESKLVVEFGEEYRRYRERVPMFVPGRQKQREKD